MDLVDHMHFLLAKMQVEHQQRRLLSQRVKTGDISVLGPFELEALQDWEYKFMSKYVKVGTIKKTVNVTEGSDVGTSDTMERIAETTKGTSSREDHDAQKEDVTAALGAKAEHQQNVEGGWSCKSC